jgi:hypothetical protein
MDWDLLFPILRGIAKSVDCKRPRAAELGDTLFIPNDLACRVGNPVCDLDRYGLHAVEIAMQQISASTC